MTRLAILVLAFVAAPLLLYDPFRAADAGRRAMLLRDAQHQAAVIAAALQPLLAHDDPRAVERIDEASRAFTAEGSTLRIVRVPPGQGEDAAFLVAAHPPASEAEFETLRARLGAAAASLGGGRCAGSQPLELRVAGSGGTPELLAAAAKTETATGCWTVLVGWTEAPFLASSLGRPFWDTPEMRRAGLAHLGLFAVAATVLGLAAWQRRRERGATIDEPIAVKVTAPAMIVDPPASSMIAPEEQTRIAAVLREAKASARAALTIDLRKQVADRVFAFHEDCARNGLSLAYEAVHPVPINGSAKVIDSLVGEMLDRALAASVPGDVVRVAVRGSGSQAMLIVEDGGHGEPDRATRLNGVRRDVEALGGRLAAEGLAGGVLRLTAHFTRAADPAPVPVHVPTA